MATAGLPPMPGNEPQQAQQPPQEAMGGLVPQQQAPQPDVQEMAKGVIKQTRDLMAVVDGIASQFPSSSKAARQVKEGLKAMSISIIQELSRQREQTATPRTLV